jgi:uncharacterized protein
MQLTDIYIYPVKSLAGIRLEQATVQLRGLQYDRRWMIVTPEGDFLTQRNVPELALLGTAIEPPYLILFDRFNTHDRVAVPLHSADDEDACKDVSVWDDRLTGTLVSPDADAWLSEKLSIEVQLVAMPEHSTRAVDSRYAPDGQYVSFADGYPFLLVGTASLADLNQRLAQPVPMNRFRPNLVFSGGQPYEEETWSDFTIGGLPFQGVKPCARCVMTTIHQDTGRAGSEPLKTLSGYRRDGNKVLFGQNVIWMGTEGVIKVGDLVSPVPPIPDRRT